MTMKKTISGGYWAAVFLLCGLGSAQAQWTRLYSFTNGPAGARPYGNIVLSGDTLYCATTTDGGSGNGTLFAINADGSNPRALASPSEMLMGGVLLHGSKFFTTGGSGTAGYGSVVSMNTDGSGITTLHNFLSQITDGAYPQGGLVASGSMLYGATSQGGVGHTDNGTIFATTTNGGSHTILHTFDGSIGAGEKNPSASPTVVGSKLFGTVGDGGPGGKGVVYSMDTDGTDYSVVKSFAGGTVDGAYPSGPLLISGSTLYGMTSYGGASDEGTIFSISTNGADFTLLHSFAYSLTDGVTPVAGSLTLSPIDNKLYGMTGNGGANNGGMIFAVNTDGSDYTNLWDFSLWGNPQDLVLSDDGTTLYGTTQYGGDNYAGEVFELSVIPEPSTLALLGVFGFAWLGRRRLAARNSAVAPE